MLSKRYVPTNIESLEYEENLVKHYRKLEEIQREDRKKKNVDKELIEKAKFTGSREKAIKFHISERTNAIEKDNELLLGRLVEISRKKPGVLAQMKSETNLPKTLNGPSRRREKNRIAAENEAFARRLLSQQPSFNPKKLELDYEKHHQRVRNMAKLAHFSPRKIRLPPIKYADLDNRDRDFKKTVKYVKKVEYKKKLYDVEVDVQPREVSPAKTQGKDSPVKSKAKVDVPAKTQGKDDVPAKTQVKQDEPVKPETDNQAAKNDGAKDGAKDGVKDGAKEGAKDGVKEGAKDGVKDGAKDGAKEGAKDGVKDGAKEGAKDSQVDNKPVEEPIQEDLNNPGKDQKKHTSAVNDDNKSQGLPENLPKSGTNHDQKVNNNNAPNDAVGDQKPEDKPVEEDLPEQIPDDTKEGTA